MEIKFSIIIPVYNKEQTIERCLKSILNNKYETKYEIIIVDDGSTDGSMELCKKYATIYKKIKIISQTNMGCLYARKKGIESTIGKYVSFVDADDYVSDEYFKVLNELVRNSADLYILDNYVNSRGKKTFHLEHAYKESQYISHEVATSMILDGTSPVVWNKIYIGDILRKIEIDCKISYGDDIYINIAYMKYVDKIFLSNKAVYYYYVDSQTSICANSKAYKRLDEQQIVYSYGLDFLKKCNYNSIIPSFTDATRRTYVFAIYELLKAGERKNNIYNYILNHDIMKNNSHKSTLKAICNWLIINHKIYCLTYIIQNLRIVKNKCKKK